jgi:protein phosphatase
MPQIEFSQWTRAGEAQERNEDLVGCWPHEDGIVFALAGGLGGRELGRCAAELALSVLGDELGSSVSSQPIATRLRRAVNAANFAVYQKAVAVPELAGMATTLTVTALVGNLLTAAHVGDCRLWLLRAGTLTQLTKDHTWVWSHLPGTAPPTPGRDHPRRYSLPRCLGHELIVSIDLLSMELHAGDVLLQSTDGLHGAVSEPEMQALLAGHPPDVACQALVARARVSEATDDATAQVAVVRAVPEAANGGWWTRLVQPA